MGRVCYLKKVCVGGPLLELVSIESMTSNNLMKGTHETALLEGIFFILPILPPLSVTLQSLSEAL